MKKVLIGLIAIVSIFGLLSCESNSLDPMSGDSGDNSLARRHGGRSNPACPAEGTVIGLNASGSSEYAVYEYTLWADEDQDAGTVTITNDDESIYVTYNSIETMTLDEAHVFVWTSLDDIPDSRPKNRDADYEAEDIDDSTYTFAIPMSVVCGGDYYITAHASVYSNEDDDDENDEDDDDEDDEDDDCDNDGRGNGHNSHGNGHGNGHNNHGNGHGYGHDDHDRSMEAYAGDALSPECFDDSNKWWAYLSYTVDCFTTISGSAYEDVDNSGTLNSGETGFAGITISVSGSDGNFYTALTDVDGTYILEHLATGVDYTIIASDPSGDYETTENAGGYILANLVGDESPVNFGFYLALNLSDCGTSETLYAGVDLVAGIVSIANDEDNLYITFDTNDLADLGEVYLEINPQFRNVGNPASYNANAYIVATDLPADSYTITVPFADTGFTCADQFIVKALAVLIPDALSGFNTFDGISAFGGDNYTSTRAGDYGDIEYSSCCPSGGPQ